jgi:hypothetical protein
VISLVMKLGFLNTFQGTNVSQKWRHANLCLSYLQIIINSECFLRTTLWTRFSTWKCFIIREIELRRKNKVQPDSILYHDNVLDNPALGVKEFLAKFTHHSANQLPV